MLVVAIQSFAAIHGGQTYIVPRGKQLDMPAGADWVRAKFVLPVIEESAPETASIDPGSETAVLPKAKAKK